MSTKAVTRVLGLSLILALAASPATAQSSAEPTETPDPICGVLTDQEVSDALGTPMSYSVSDETFCEWWDGHNYGATLSVQVRPQPLADFTEGAPNVPVVQSTTPTEIAGRPALITDEGWDAFVEVDDGTLWVSTSGFAEGQVAALRTLAEIALGRLPSIQLKPTPEPLPSPTPAPSFLGDPELAGLFPDAVGGQPLEVQTRAGAEVFGTTDPASDPNLQAFIDLLATQGKTIDDLSIGSASFAADSASGMLMAIRVRGADMPALADGLLHWLAPDNEFQPTTAEIAGHQVIQATDGTDGAAAYAYAKDDILWFVQASEPQLSELVGQLP